MLLKTILLASMLTFASAVDTYVCNVFQVKNFATGEVSFPEDEVIKLFEANGNLYRIETNNDNKIFESTRDKTKDGETDKGIKYRTYKQPNGIFTSIYDDYKEGAFIYKEDMTVMKTITPCKKQEPTK
jgi:hypothetical protein